MKTIKLTGALAELLIVELPENTQSDVLFKSYILKDGIKFLTGTEEKFHFIEGSYTILGKPDDITEEDAVELVELFSIQSGRFKDYLRPECGYETAKESLISYLESEIYWVNPLGEKHDVELIACRKAEIAGKYLLSLWNEGQSRTFDRNRTLILVKN